MNTELQDLLDNCIFICIGPNVWGRGKTPSEAIAQCRKAYGKPLREYDLHLAHKDTVVNDMGGFTRPSETPYPAKIDSVRIKEKRKV
jgi:hypothetical protein